MIATPSRRLMARQYSGKSRYGFTLLEMMVVVVIIGIVSGLVVVNAQPSPRNLLEHQAQRLILLLQDAHQEARLRAQPIAWEATPQSYRFLVRDGEGWQPMRDEILRAGSWGAPLSALTVAQPNSAPQAGAVRVLFGREPMEPTVTITLERDGARASILTTAPGRYVVQ